MFVNSFNQWIAESEKKEDLFDTVKKGDIILYAGARYRVEKINRDGAHEVVPVKQKGDGEPKVTKLNRSQFNQKCREVND